MTAIRNQGTIMTIKTGGPDESKWTSSPRLVFLGCDFLLRFAVQVRIVLVGFPVERVEVDGSGRHRLGGFHFRLVFVVCRHVVCFGN